MTKYIIEITPIVTEQNRTGGRNDSPYMTTIETDDIEWSMEQYQRNRPPLKYKVLARHNAYKNEKK